MLSMLDRVESLAHNSASETLRRQLKLDYIDAALRAKPWLRVDQLTQLVGGRCDLRFARPSSFYGRPLRFTFKPQTLSAPSTVTVWVNIDWWDGLPVLYPVERLEVMCYALARVAGWLLHGMTDEHSGEVLALCRQLGACAEPIGPVDMRWQWIEAQGLGELWAAVDTRPVCKLCELGRVGSTHKRSDIHDNCVEWGRRYLRTHGPALPPSTNPDAVTVPSNASVNS